MPAEPHPTTLKDDVAVDSELPAPIDDDYDGDDVSALHARMPRVLPTLFPGPPDWSVVFGRRAPLEVELGFGRPHFLLERAVEVPAHDIVGLEWKGRWPKTVWDKQAKGSYANVRAVHGNAWLLFGALFRPHSVSRLFLSFPDPWWKAKHRKRRIISDAFAALVHSRLEVGGTLLVQTDVATLLEELLSRFEAQPQLRNIAGAGRLSRKPITASTHREKRCRVEGIPIFRAILQKVA